MGIPKFYDQQARHSNPFAACRKKACAPFSSKPASAFHPKPQVDAALLHLTLKPQPDLPQTLQGEFLRFLSAALSSGGLRRLFTKKQLATAAKRAGLAPGFTTGDIRYIQWLCLFRCWRYFAGHGAG